MTTAPAAELGTLLYEQTHNLAYLQFAEKAYEWVRALPAAAGEPVCGSHRRQGRGGTAAVELQPGLDDRRGHAALPGDGQLRLPVPGAPDGEGRACVLHNEKLGSEIPFFVSVYFRNLLYLDSVTHDPPGPAIAQSYVNYAWQHLRLSNNMFVFGAPASAQLLVQAAIVQIYALLSSPASTYF